MQIKELFFFPLSKFPRGWFRKLCIQCSFQPALAGSRTGKQSFRTDRHVKNLICVFPFDHPPLPPGRPLNQSVGNSVVSVQLKCDGTRGRRGGQVKGKLANAVGS